ncbi:flagellar assembly protein FliH [Salinibius halmophilus]|uniref:flagellar assembly protein FliH n=1 Tax=Salinibius halmophilus TaxID=1853216 RepID=UPI000E65FEE2|nr:flagellar assembly protein FliH [Salinibius halmophilus]
MSDVKSWPLPPFKDDDSQGRKSAAGFSAPERAEPKPEQAVAPVDEVEEETYRAPTAEELTALFEETKAEAYQEGLAQGRKEGFDAGFSEGKAEGLEKGTEEGLQAGEKQGYDESLKRGQAEIKQQVQKLQGIMRQLNQPMVEQEADVERAVVSLALQVAAAVIGHEVRTATDRIETLVRTAIHALPHGADYIQVMLHPDDTTLISQYAPDLVKETSVKADPTISRGGVMVKTNQSLIDLTLERSWQQQVASIIEQAELSVSQQSLFDQGQHFTSVLQEDENESFEPEVESVSSIDSGATGDTSSRPLDEDGGANSGSSGSERDGGGSLPD